MFSNLFLPFQNIHDTISVYGLENRTTSLLESFHSTLNRSLTSHPSFFTFVDGLKSHEFSKATDFSNNFNGLYTYKPRKRKRALNRNEIIDELSNELRAKRIGLYDFLEATAKLSLRQY